MGVRTCLVLYLWIQSLYLQTVTSAVSSFKSWLDLYLRLKYQKKIGKPGLVRAAQKPRKCFLMNSVTNTEV